MENIIAEETFDMGGETYTIQFFNTSADLRIQMRVMNDSAQEVWPGGLDDPPWVGL